MMSSSSATWPMLANWREGKVSTSQVLGFSDPDGMRGPHFREALRGPAREPDGVSSEPLGG
jgi:hypothetical protein